jgi:hypothetical protein
LISGPAFSNAGTFLIAGQFTGTISRLARPAASGGASGWRVRAPFYLSALFPPAQAEFSALTGTKSHRKDFKPQKAGTSLPALLSVRKTFTCPTTPGY